jgi:hypothetical protein
MTAMCTQKQNLDLSNEEHLGRVRVWCEENWSELDRTFKTGNSADFYKCCMTWERRTWKGKGKHDLEYKVYYSSFTNIYKVIDSESLYKAILKVGEEREYEEREVYFPSFNAVHNDVNVMEEKVKAPHDQMNLLNKRVSELEEEVESERKAKKKLEETNLCLRNAVDDLSEKYYKAMLEKMRAEDYSKYLQGGIRFCKECGESKAKVKPKTVGETVVKKVPLKARPN